MTILNDINPIVDVLKNLSGRGIKCNLLVGAGCSVSAEIPMASGIIEIIEKKFPSIYSMVPEKTYANCMNALSPDERIDLIKDLVHNSKLNITHIIIAELIKRGYIHRVLTPNFDNLLIKACSVVNEYPPIYDLAAYEEFKPEHIPEKCIFYLHGQFTGFKLMNTQQEVTDQANKLAGLFHRLNERSVWIIVGFSGLNDALFKLLSEEKIYSNRLFWIGYKNDPPHEELKNNILKEGKYGFYVNGFDSDGFFWNLANRLDCFPPTFLMQPFSYIKDIVEQIVPYQPSKNLDFNKATNNIIQDAIDKFEKDPIFMADCYYNFGLYDNVIEMEDILIKKKKKGTLARAYFMKAYEMQSEEKDEKYTDNYLKIIELYGKSHEFQSYHGCFNNTGLCYYAIAKIDKSNMEIHIIESLNSYLRAIEEGGIDYPYTNSKASIVYLIENKNLLRGNTSENIIEKANELDGLREYKNPSLFQNYYEWLDLILDGLQQNGIENEPLIECINKLKSFSEKEIQKNSLKETS